MQGSYCGLSRNYFGNDDTNPLILSNQLLGPVFPAASETLIWSEIEDRETRDAAGGVLERRPVADVNSGQKLCLCLAESLHQKSQADSFV